MFTQAVRTPLLRFILLLLLSGVSSAAHAAATNDTPLTQVHNGDRTLNLLPQGVLKQNLWV